eukprot:9886892-Alexandrium_andersonii.AAC.1
MELVEGLSVAARRSWVVLLWPRAWAPDWGRAPDAADPPLRCRWCRSSRRLTFDTRVPRRLRRGGGN